MSLMSDSVTDIGDGVKHIGYHGVVAPDRTVPRTLPQALGRVRVALEHAYVRASRDLGLTGQQAELLCAALRPTSIGDLAEALRCDRSNVSRLVDRASARGLLRRTSGEADGRVTMVELTPEGQHLATRFLAVLAAQTETLRASWPERRRHAAVELLEEISDALDASRRPPAERGR